jgi:ABC-type nitrate/sulfonate/bicarbonate transport system substrate-binding protein
LSAIQLDYAQMLVRANPAEARRLYAAVKARTPANSPLASRLKQLSRTFE